MKPPTAGEQVYQSICFACHGADRKGIGHAPPLRGLRLLGALPGTLHYVVPDRRVHGYGLTPAIVELAQAHAPRLPQRRVVRLS